MKNSPRNSTREHDPRAHIVTFHGYIRVEATSKHGALNKAHALIDRAKNREHVRDIDEVLGGIIGLTIE